MSPSLRIGRIAPLTGTFYGFGVGAFGEGTYGIGTGSDVSPSLWGARVADMDGDTLSLAGFIHAPGVVDALYFRQQLLGYADNPDEEAIPITWGADATISGYYRVRKAAVNMHGASLAHGRFDWQMQLERVARYAAPKCESVLLGAVRTNSHGITGSWPWHATPSDVTEYTKTGVAASYYRESEDGSMRLNLLTGFDATPRFSLTPEDYYIGAATFELGAGATLRAVVGKQAENLPTQWRLSNGLVRITPTGNGRLDISWFNGSSWSTPKAFQLRVTASYIVTNFASVVVLRNSPEEVVIRLACTCDGGLTVGPVDLDLSLRRGARTVSAYVASDQPYQWRIQTEASEAASAFSGGPGATAGGIGAVANDADDNRYVLFSSKAFSTDLTHGAIYANVAATGFDFGIGSVVGGAAATFPDDALTLAMQYFAAQSERQSVGA